MVMVGVGTRECRTDSTAMLSDGGKDDIPSLSLNEQLNPTRSLSNGVNLSESYRNPRNKTGEFCLLKCLCSKKGISSNIADKGFAFPLSMNVCVENLQNYNSVKT
jgi:hypothetical protein